MKIGIDETTIPTTKWRKDLVCFQDFFVDNKIWTTLLFVVSKQPDTNIEPVLGAFGASVFLLVVGGIILYIFR